MSPMKIQVIKGVNSYTDDLVKKENRNLNRRREVNFNVNNLNEHERSSSRAKSFAVYKPKSRPKNKTKSKMDAEDEDETENSENYCDTDDSGKSSDRVVNQEESSDDVYNFSDSEDYDVSEGDNVNSEDKKAYKSGYNGFKEVFERRKIESNENDDEIGDYSFSSNRDHEDSLSVQSSRDKEPNNVFKKLRDRIKEKYDKSSFKELHEKNMESMRKQFKAVLWKKSSGEDYSDDGTDSGGSDYWESKADTNFEKEDLNPKPFGLGINRFHPKNINYDSDNDEKKRCCC